MISSINACFPGERGMNFEKPSSVVISGISKASIFSWCSRASLLLTMQSLSLSIIKIIKSIKQFQNLLFEYLCANSFFAFDSVIFKVFEVSAEEHSVLFS